MGKLAIKVEGLSKEYVVGARERGRQTFREMLVDSFKAPIRRLRQLRSDTRGGQAFYALEDISFKVESGEVVGIIGPNGAGKTTLLKILSRVTEPTGGYAAVGGRVGSLLEVGTGFHTELTGRENIYLNGAILGMRRTEIDRKFDEIVAFSGIEDFLDTPVKRYSTGMYVRLAFSVAAHLEAEVLLVDEVLAVGDMSFQKKCLGKMDDMAKVGRTILFVSHQLNQVRRLCSRAICIDGGKVKFCGSPSEVIESYQNTVMSTPRVAEDKDGGFVSWEAIGWGNTIQNTSNSIEILVEVNLKRDVTDGHFGMALLDPSDNVIAGWAFEGVSVSAGLRKFRISLPMLPVRPGVYGIIFSIFNQGNNLTGGKLIDLWHAMPKLIIDTDAVTHPQERWAGVLNIPATLSAEGHEYTPAHGPRV